MIISDGALRYSDFVKMRFNLHGQEKNGKAAAVVKKTRDCLQSCGAEGAAYVARRRKK